MPHVKQFIGEEKTMSIRNDIINECIAVVENTVCKNCNDHNPYYGACQNCGRYNNPDVPDYYGILEKLQSLKEGSPRQENKEGGGGKLCHTDNHKLKIHRGKAKSNSTAYELLYLWRDRHIDRLGIGAWAEFNDLVERAKMERSRSLCAAYNKGGMVNGQTALSMGYYKTLERRGQHD